MRSTRINQRRKRPPLWWILAIAGSVAAVGWIGSRLSTGSYLSDLSADQSTSATPDQNLRRALAPAPDFTVELIGGASFTLSEHLAVDGRPVVLNFWASWCFPCREEMPDFDAVSHEVPEVLVIGIAVEDTPQAAREFAAEVGVSYPLGIDLDRTVASAYSVFGLPTTLIINENGTMLREVTGQLTKERLLELIAQDLEL